MNNISENLKNIRKEKNLTQQQMADILFVTQQTVSNWEKGKNMPTVDMLVDIAGKLNVDIYDLLYGYNGIPARQRKKAGVMAAVAAVMLPVFFITDRIGMEIRRTTYRINIYRLSRIFILPVMLFIIGYSAMLFYRSKDKKQSAGHTGARRCVQVAVIAYMIMTATRFFLAVTAGVFVLPPWLDPLWEFLVKLWNIAVTYPWIYLLLGAVYSLAEVWSNKEQG